MSVLSKLNNTTVYRPVQLNNLVKYLNFFTNKYLSVKVSEYRAIHWLFDQLDLNPDDVILDLDCHYADLWINNKLNFYPSIKVFLVDQHLVNVRLTQQNLINQSFDYTVQLMDYSNLQYRSNLFDKIIIKLGFNSLNLTEQLSMINESHRVLKKGQSGYFVINENKIEESLNKLLMEFDNQITNINQVEIEYTALKKHISSLFQQISISKYQNDMIVTSAKQIIDMYTTSNHQLFIDEIIKKHRIKEFDLFWIGYN